MNWSRKSLDELEAFYWDTVAPAMDREGMDPTRDVPTYEWLTDHGWSGIAYALREKHDLTPRDFFVDVVGLGEDESDAGYEWGIDAEATVEAFESYLDMLESRRGLADSTLPTRRTHLARFARTYRDLHGTADLLSRLDDRDAEPDEIDRCLNVLDEFDDELATDGTKLKYLQTVRAFYEYLVDFRRARYNPVENAAKQFRWEQGQPDNRTMTAEQVGRVYGVADDLEERLLVLGLAGWGLRPNELASLDASQLVLTGDDPHIAFEERKNGPGTVALLYGVDAVAARTDDLSDDDWNGALFPSSRSSTGHIARETVNRRFKRLASEAGVTVDGKVPTAKLCRRFWYTAYQEAVDDMLAQLEGVAADQGSKSASVVMSNYLSEERRRSFRRQAMREKLAAVFESEADGVEVGAEQTMVN
ncbi:site-specific integrase (plasmid) [Haloferax mediterranei ATCC 33500]|uniref:Integrase n=1 Tax=Haloferax mediterranei (strain ATCC 33500 / DSM 1411 / JCM 8866 / NBRC 14739 / NCIMB 2177 / R-4) TaxID=523841 RepID=I3RAM4_HALMT|nr:tyrosine-type recombinase/integrase [Haloferax mediterranei]AFK21284.1 phage integrase [Haloferax mediterranei ATCC 33500]AHZ24618.1 integrase [Haloferax mediterranei ATCC 33500]ELZ97384.1 phage integrase [Haloferax mediterranei ATCC 33500]MDX5990321.1 tyrosine-type recombinase/integrase [Haloferax mediterranei ATCC 33500]QCQ77014.1 site-specific integrase [Haloferax mediterranei ATCC 33500]